MWKPLKDLKKLPSSLLRNDGNINPKYQIDKVYIAGERKGQRCRMDLVINKDFFKNEQIRLDYQKQKKIIPNFVFEYRQTPKKRAIKK